MGDYPLLQYRRDGEVLVVRPVLRVLGPWDGADPPQPEVIELLDQLCRLTIAEDGPLLLDLSRYEFAPNWGWFVLLVRDCSRRQRRLAVWVSPAVAEQFAVIKYDRLVAVRTTFAEAVSALRG